MLKNNGHSGATIVIDKNVVYKRGSSRLLGQLVKQNEFFSFCQRQQPVCQTVLAQTEDSDDDTRVCISMPYINAFSFPEIGLPELSVVMKWASTINNYLHFVMERATLRQFSTLRPVFQQKLESLSGSLSPSVASVMNSCLMAIDEDLWVPCGFCHGDFTYANMLVNSINEIFLVDFLDSFFESPLQDLSKLRQDLVYHFCEHLDPSYAKVEMRLLSFMLTKTIQEEWMEWWDSPLMKLVDMFTLARIIPYHPQSKPYLEACIVRNCTSPTLGDVQFSLVLEETKEEFPQKVTILVPAAGRSSRFPGMRPKWLLTQPNGDPMILDCLKGLDMTNVKQIIFTILDEHVTTYCDEDLSWCPSHFRDVPITLCRLPAPTCDQVDTIQQTLQRMEITGPIFTKDCDNQFFTSISSGNYTSVCVVDKETRDVNAKSFVVSDHADHLLQIAEKRVISHQFNCGGYAFRSAKEFLDAATQLREMCADNSSIILNVSHVIQLFLYYKRPFHIVCATRYADWGTYDTWIAYRSQFKTLAIDIDGVIVENGSGFGKKEKQWGRTPSLPKNVDYFKRIYASGKYQFILFTARPASTKGVTERQLHDLGFPFDHIVYGCYHSQRVLINDFSETNPYPTAKAISIHRNGDDVEHYRHEIEK